ncbi:MAG: hypothetical protein IPF67_01340 [Saprospiraceae bacterium]|nr:hypothetical protein [Candidatus Brachybacter algidus]
MIKSIVFDLGGVLIDWNPMYVYENYFESKERQDTFFNEVATFEWNEEQDAGKPLAQATRSESNSFPNGIKPSAISMVVGKKCLAIGYMAQLRFSEN